ncbi:MAG: NADPH:quinone oxidoreductase family protein [Acidimicrobiales bacterium]|nr:NADPH:quinone oxidoreductase family protein [Acidimicrobiales bacterium]
MKAVLSHAPGGPETLSIEEVPAPSAGPGKVVIEVKAIGVNFPDSLIIQDLYQLKPPRPFAPGGELSGVVTEVGEGVTNLAVGDRVLAVPGHGAMVESIEVDAASCIPIPDGMPFDDAACLLLTYATSYYALKDRAKAQPGESLFILGASGGVGLAALQLGKAMGLRVIAGCSSQDKLDLCIEHGADTGIVYERQPFDRDQQKALSGQIKEAGGGGVDVIYDAVGGDYSEPSVRAMNWDGRFLVIGFPAGIPKLPLNLTLLKNCQIVGVFWGASVMVDPEGHQRNVADLFDLYAEGKIKPFISSRYSLEQAGAAITELIERRARGKIVIEV